MNSIILIGWNYSIQTGEPKIHFPSMTALEFIRGHVTFKLRYDQIYQMKTTTIQKFCVNTLNFLL